MTSRPPAAELVKNPEALLTRTDLLDLGLPRRAQDAVFRHCKIVFLPGYRRGLVKVRDYLEFIESRSSEHGRTWMF